MKFNNYSQFAGTQSAKQLRRTSPLRDDENRLIPLINVVFLMLIFFLLVGTIRAPEPQVVNPPVSVVDQARATQAVTVTVDSQLQVFVNNTAFSDDKVAGLGSAVRALWTDSATDNQLQLRRLEIRADKSLTMSRLGPIIRALSNAGADELSLITQRAIAE